MSALEIRGRAAAPGLAMGRVYRLAEPTVGRRSAGDAEAERAALAAGMALASAGLSAMTADADADGAAILEFQIAMLGDDALAEPAYAAIAAGRDAASAFAAAMDAAIADYRAAEDAYFAARVSDLEDIRDRVLAALSGEGDRAAPPPGAVLVGRDVTPSRFLAVDWSAGGAIALSEGSPSSHVAMLARARGVPLVVGLGSRLPVDAREAIVDGETGLVLFEPDEAARAALARRRQDEDAAATAEARAARAPARTADGLALAIHINIAQPEDLDGIDPAIADGIGLVRTEFLFHDRGGLPDEETQYRAYRRMVEWAGERPVTIRTIDAGGDKPVPHLTVDAESNPFLGTRGIRLSLLRPEIFQVQLRALARAAAHGRLKVMLPMVTVPREVTAAVALLDAVIADLKAQGIAHRRPSLGIMVEVPAVALVPELFGAADFFSIGSNDLTQYTTAAARDIAGVATLCDPAHPAVTALIANVVRAGKAMGRDVSLCGDMAGDPAHLPALLAAGLRSLSLAPRLVGRVKRALAGLSSSGAAHGEVRG